MKFLGGLVLFVIALVLLQAPEVNSSFDKNQQQETNINKKTTEQFTSYKSIKSKRISQHAQQLWGWSDFTDWAKGAYNDTKEWAKDSYKKGKEWATEKVIDEALGIKINTFQKLSNIKTRKALQAWGWSDFTDWAKGAYDKSKNWAQEAYNETKDWAQDKYQKGKELVEINAWIQTKVNKLKQNQKIRKQKLTFLLKQESESDINKTISELEPLLTEALNEGPEVYGQLKEQTLDEISSEHGEEAVAEAQKLFEQFEIDYISEQLESMRPLLEIAQAFGGQAELEKVEEDLVSQLTPILEPAAIEEIKEFFYSVYQTQLLKKLKLIKQENATEASEQSQETLTMEQEFQEIIPILTEVLDQGFEPYSQIKQDALAEILKVNGDEVAEQARQLFEGFEVEYTQRILEEMRPLFEEVKQYEGAEGLQAYEQAYIEELTPIFEPAAIEEIQKFFQTLRKVINLKNLKIIGLWGWSDFTDWAKGTYNDTKEWAKDSYKKGKEWATEKVIDEALGIKINTFQKLSNIKTRKALQAWGWSDFTDWAKGAYDKSKNWAQEAYNETKDWAQDKYQKGKELVEINAWIQTKVAKFGKFQKLNKKVFARTIKTITTKQDFNQTFQELEPLLTEALNEGPEVYGQLKEQTLDEISSEHGEEAVAEAQKLFEQFEIDYISEQLEGMRPLLEIAQVFGGQAELEKVEEDLVSQLSPILESAAIEEIKMFFESVYQTQLFKNLKLKKQEAVAENSSEVSSGVTSEVTPEVTNEVTPEVTNEELTFEQALEELTPLLTEALNQGFQPYVQIKEQILEEVKSVHGEQSMDEVKQIFEQFEIQYTKNILEEMRSFFEEVKAQDPSDLYEIEQAYLEQLVPVFEPAAIEELKNFFQNLMVVKTVKLLKNNPPTKEEIQVQFTEIEEDLLSALESDKWEYSDLKFEFLRTYLNDYQDTETYLLAVEVVVEFETDYFRTKIEENQDLVDQLKQDGLLEAWVDEVFRKGFGVFEVDSLQAFYEMVLGPEVTAVKKMSKKTQTLKKKSSQDEMFAKFQTMEGDLIAALENDAPAYYLIKQEMLEECQQNFSEETQNQLRQLFIDLEITYFELEFERSQEEIAQMKQDGSLQGFEKTVLSHFLPYLEPETLEQLDQMFQNLIKITKLIKQDLTQEEVQTRFEEVEKDLLDALEESPDAYKEVKESFLLEFVENFKGYENYMQAKELIVQFEIDFLQEQIELNSDQIQKLKTDGLLESWQVSISEGLWGIFDVASLEEFESMVQNLLVVKANQTKTQQLKKELTLEDLADKFEAQKERLVQALIEDTFLNYYIIKDFMISNIQDHLGEEGLAELKELFKNFEIEYFQQQFQQTKEVFKEMQEQGTLEQFKESVFNDAAGIFEPEALEQLENMFQNLYKAIVRVIKKPRESKMMSFRKLIQLQSSSQSGKIFILGTQILIPSVQLENQPLVYQIGLPCILILMFVGAYLMMKGKKRPNRSFAKLKKKEAEELLIVKEL